MASAMQRGRHLIEGREAGERLLVPIDRHALHPRAPGELFEAQGRRLVADGAQKIVISLESLADGYSALEPRRLAGRTTLWLQETLRSRKPERFRKQLLRFGRRPFPCAAGTKAADQPLSHRAFEAGDELIGFHPHVAQTG